MKKIFYFLAVPVFIMMFTLTGCSGSKQVAVPDVSAEAVTDAINKNEWVFTANYVLPQTGRSRATNGIYTVTSSDNKFLVSLPYFGRAYSAPINSNTGPLDFKTVDFDLNKDQKKEGEWRLALKPKDYSEVQIMNFTFYSNGTASLDITLTNRSPISFRGTVVPKK